MSQIRILALIILLPLVSPSFEVVGDNVNVQKLSCTDKLNIAQIDLKNLSDTTLNLRWKRVANTLPPEWDYSMCAYGQCQIGIPRGGKLRTVKAGEEGFIAIHVFPQGTVGQGSVIFELVDTENESHVERIEFKVEAY